MYNRFFRKGGKFKSLILKPVHNPSIILGIILVQKIITLKRDAYEPERLKPEFRLILFDSYTGNIYR